MTYPHRLGAVPAGQAGIVSTPQQPQVQYVQDFFIYGIDILAIVAGATANNNIQIQADCDFKLVKLGMQADIAAAAQTDSGRVIPLVTLQIVDTGSGRQVFSTPIAMGALFGTGPLPFILPVPRIFKARTNISLSFTNYSAATTYNLRCAFIGNKIFAQGSQGT
jgi:hypothetical protein